ncbi:plastocyanin/azurin family copper-binding protein [Rhodococcus artemisiae]|uniref:Cupredoxin domain-containing protein n=1 Tax=Rhodococcus artemisiae TaxID=714159 RepID=A0ABU7LEN1_9NOCA|nr:cupredoxin domain-containing protein [Rhodococcus artemisiae]MEE2060004.1 cupredoxin domain-containing protein [Rhodococcus artemisiae]
MMQGPGRAWSWWALTIGVAALASTGCSAAERPDTVIEISNVQYNPMDATVSVGDTVEWRFDDGGVLHRVESPGEFDSGITGEGTFSHTFDRPGVYSYICSIHPYMTGTVTVH